MQRIVNTARMAALFAIVGVLIVVYIIALLSMQVVSKAADDELSSLDTSSSYVNIEAPRGDLLDRNGVPLITTREAYDCTLSRDQLLELEDTNGELLKIINAADELGVKYIDTFPITPEAPFSYVDMDDDQTYRFGEYLDFFGLRHDITASDLIVWLKDHYGLDYRTDLNTARRIIGLRYEMEIRVIVNIDPYVFASDVDIDFISVVKERGYIGVNFAKRFAREYQTSSAAQLLGYISYMDEVQYAYYKTLGYPMNAQIGQEGAEKAFEEYLHGQDGLKSVVTLSDGTVVQEKVIQEAQPGQNVYLSLDIALQKVSEEALTETIRSINAKRTSEDDMVTGGALVITQPKTGQVLTSVSLPDYDPATMIENYEALLETKNNPLFNRATQGTYNPGSTFKMTTGFAGLQRGLIDRDFCVFDGGTYTAYEDYQPECWIHANTGGGHGDLNIIGALQNSCNVFFWYVADHIGCYALADAAKEFGFGSPTGIEIPEADGLLATPEYKEEYENEEWYAADTLIAAIGQGYTVVTPLQLANYCATIANGGTLNQLTLLNRVKSFDYSTVTYIQPTTTLHQIAETDYIKILQEGMEAVTEGSGSAEPVFNDCEIKVGAKTGTVQSDGTKITDGAFLCYAPADDPEIAIAIVVEKGVSGTTIMSTARKIVDYYFSDSNGVDIALDYVLLP
ncbi:MAG: hypothetical protein HUJ65_02965 [Oscillospiraceae bacterium]|nr:hypothetical protein [Oscillospiraceae bacterium]